MLKYRINIIMEKICQVNTKTAEKFLSGVQILEAAVSKQDTNKYLY